MKVAICLSGQPRHVEEAFPYIKKSVLDQNPDHDVFIHAWWNPEEIGKQFVPHHPDALPPDTDKKMLSLYSPKAYQFEQQKPFDGKKYNPHHYGHPYQERMVANTQSQYYSVMAVNKVRKEYEKITGTKYDAIIRLRFDLRLNTPLNVSNFDLRYIHCKNCCFHEPGCMSDHSAWGNVQNMNTYMNVFECFDELAADGCPFCPEVLLGRLMRKRNIPVQMHHLKSCLIRDRFMYADND